MSLFGWGKPKCSVGYREKAWVETRMRWLGEQLGMERLTRCKVILPTEEYFPDAYDATPEAANRLLDRVCDYMQVSRAGIELEVLTKDDVVQSAERDQPGLISVLDVELDDPMDFAALLATHLAYHSLTERRLLRGDSGYAWTTELATVYFGLGIFCANTNIRESHAHGGRRP